MNEPVVGMISLLVNACFDSRQVVHTYRLRDADSEGLEAVHLLWRLLIRSGPKSDKAAMDDYVHSTLMVAEYSPGGA
jgi:hypothetical protein